MRHQRQGIDNLQQNQWFNRGLKSFKSSLAHHLVLHQFLSPDGDDCVDEATRAEVNIDGMETCFSEMEKVTVLREMDI